MKKSKKCCEKSSRKPFFFYRSSRNSQSVRIPAMKSIFLRTIPDPPWFKLCCQVKTRIIQSILSMSFSCILNALINHWKSILKKEKCIISQREFFKGQYIYLNRTKGNQPFDSDFTHLLQTREWLLTKDGVLKGPSKTHRIEIHPDLQQNDELCTALCMRMGTLDEDKKRSRQEHIQALGLGEKDLENIELLKRHPDEFERWKTSISAKKEKPALPTKTSEKPFDYHSELKNVFNRPGETIVKVNPESDDHHVRNPDRRREKEAEAHKERIINEPDSSERRKITEGTILEGPNEQVRQTLEEWYAGKCQICGHTFSERDGRPFFIANNIVPRKLAQQVDTYANALCLCAEHFAKWHHGAVEADDIIYQIKSLQLTSEGGYGNLQLRLKLCGEECFIRFNEKHVITLQELLKAYDPNDLSGLQEMG